MPSKADSLAVLLEASARSRDYPFAERAELWEGRLALHLRDLHAVLASETAADMLILPPRAKLEIVPPAGAAVAPVPAIDDLCFASAAQIAARVRRHELSPFEIARAFVARVDAHRALHALITFRPEAVLREARHLEERLQSGEDLGALAGVPVVVKDIMGVRGYPVTCGTKATPGDEAEHDAEVVAKLHAAGALVIGTANLHELAYGVTSANVHFGTVANPIAPGHVPGGSSGGSGAAVAAGLCAIGVGTDTGGSIRIPAACCGIVGFKPSFDAISREGVWPLAWTLDHIGPLARSVADAALAFEIMAGLPPGCVSGKQIDAPRLVKPVPFFFDHLEPAVRSRVDAVLGALAGAGATLQERRIESIELAPATQFVTICTEACHANWDLLTRHAEGIGADVRLRLEIGQFIAGVDYVKAQRLRRSLRDHMLVALKDADVFALPSMPISLPRQGTQFVDIAGRTLPVPTALTRLTSPFNFSGLPAISIPCGTDEHGLPVGLQLVGRPGADATVLAVARWCETVLAGRER